MSAPPEKVGPTGETDEAKALGKLPNHYSERSGEQLVSTNGDWRAIPVSMVRNATATETSPVTLGSFVEGIRDGKWEIPVKGVRDRFEKARIKATEEGSPDPVKTAKDAVSAVKKKLPGGLLSGTFLERSNNSIAEHSGYLCLDLDNLGERLDTIREKLKTDEHVQAVWRSPTGSGLKVLVRVPPDKNAHHRSFEAAKKYFRDKYDVGIDEACKNVARLCYVGHDPDVFIRPEDAAVIEPLPEKPKPEPDDLQTTLEYIGPKGVILPHRGLVTLTESAARLFSVLGASQKFYLSNGLIGRIETKKGIKSFYPLSDQEFRSAAEDKANLWEYRSAQRGEFLLQPKALCSQDQARALMSAKERNTLPHITAIHNCPIAVEMPDGRVETLGQGYHSHAGGRLITGGELPVVPSLQEAVDIVLDMVREVSWFSPADQSRWVCIFLEPAFKSLCDWPFPSPLFIMEADASQSGKGFLLNLVNVTYNESPSFVTQRKGGVGGFDESLSTAYLKAKPIILFDNFRGKIDSTLLEASMTCPIGSTVGARVPYRPEASVNPHSYIHQLTSNGLLTTPDLANRSCICRINNQGERLFARYPEGSILERVRANQPEYLGAAHRIAREWCERGKQFSREDCRGVGSFRDWWQRDDWILRNLFDLPSPLDGHDSAQKRAADPTLGWLRELFIKLKNADRLTERLSATDILDFCELNDIEIPCRSEASKDEKAQVQRIGRLMGPFFSPEKDVWQGEGFSILRIEEPYYDSWHGEKTSKRYLFFEGAETPDVRPPSPPAPSIGPLAG